MSTAEDDFPARPRPTGGLTASAVLATPFAIARVTAARGGVVAKVWAWFVVPLGAPHIGWLHADGLSTLLLVALPFRRSSTSDNDEQRETGQTVMRHAVTTSLLMLIALGVAAVAAVLR